MKSLAYIMMLGALICSILSIIPKFFTVAPKVPILFGIGPTGYLNFAVILLLFSINTVLLQILNKK